MCYRKTREEELDLKRLAWVPVMGGVGLTTLAAMLLVSARPLPTDAQGRSRHKVVSPEECEVAPGDGHAGSITKSSGNTLLPLVKRYCLACHSTQLKRGHLDLQRFGNIEAIQRDIQPWQGVIDHLEVGDMPPPGSPQPTATEKQQIIAQTQTLLAADARAHAGDPGYVPLRSLSNAEYDATIRDLTGQDLRPTREFPVDGAAGEGFTNAAAALTDISPDLLAKYFNAAKEVADHAELLPDGIRFTAGKTRRDWTDESTARLRAFYAALPGIPPDGKLPFEPYLAATVRHRPELTSGTTTVEKVATEERLNPKYLAILWKMLTHPENTVPSYPLDTLRAMWQKTTPKEINVLNVRVAAWQVALWQTVRVGSYVHAVGTGFAESVTRQIPQDLSADQARALGMQSVGAPFADQNPKPVENQPEAARLAGYAEFRRYFPLFVCFPGVIPNDEVVSLKMFHREDEPLRTLFLDTEQARRIDRLWEEHRFISRQPVAENTYLPLFIGFVSQDQPKEMLAYFDSQRPVFRARADAFQKEEEAAIPKQWDALLDFAARAYRRPLRTAEKTELQNLYQSVRARGVAHEEALHSVLARVLVAPAFLFHMEKAPAGTAPAPVNDYELANRLSYFLWSSAPDDELRRIAASGHLHDPQNLRAQAARMLKDPRVRALAVEFGTQWINVRGFDELKEKNEKLFPTFDADLRRAIYEESVLFFQSLFQSDRPITEILDRNDTFLNETLAKHYGIPGVTGPQWRQVEGVRKYGRGGVLGLASVQDKESGASRTSPVLRGNWVVETLLGEKLPRPPANVPKLPEEEGTGNLTLRQQVQQHSQVPACAVCHRRIDPYGFALEHYDAIGRYREKEVGGLMVDAKTTLQDGTELEGIDGLRRYLLIKKRNVVLRLFCRRLLGYALGRSVVNSDQPLLDKMMQELSHNEMHTSAAIQTILQSQQFKMIRGTDYAAQ